ncbi:MAG: 2-C-methyl-D-erythritol 2,4-cyclodiphosphate synthase [Candidatus Hydrogenedentes bacterium]|nr:2-C-methyl-D-erythritol 2,4-cyclodiphosphate synthase [Candidatus Hydrogenedentota bacterium]
MMRIGTGYDLHRLVEGRPLILAGVTIEHRLGLAGHSDADVVAHAITDALLGAAALGNIGMLFPDNDPAFKDADSLVLLREAYARVQAAGYTAVNIDCTIIAQAPKLNPHVEAMRRKIAETLGLEIGQVSIKPKTNEHVGPEGREEAISAQAVALVE